MIFGFTLEVEKRATPTKIVRANFKLGKFHLIFSHTWLAEHTARKICNKRLQKTRTDVMELLLRVCEFVIKCSTRAEKRRTGKLVDWM